MFDQFLNILATLLEFWVANLTDFNFLLSTLEFGFDSAFLEFCRFFLFWLLSLFDEMASERTLGEIDLFNYRCIVLLNFAFYYSPEP